jgi:transcriptional regulator with XRE-family HTH domain
MLFSDALKDARKRAGLTQDRLARDSGLSLRTIQSWEQGRRSPVSPDFFKLVKALGVSADDFAGIAEDEAPPEPAKPKRPRKAK